MKFKEKIESNETFQIIKSIWSNKRYRSSIIFLLYILFFAVIIIGLRSRPSISDNIPEVKTSVQIIESIKKTVADYEYKIYENDVMLVNGSIKNGTNYFTYQDGKYVILNGILYIETNSNLNKVDEVLVNEISVKNIELDYILSILDDSTLYNSSDNTLEYTKNNITYRIYLKEDKINKIVINYLEKELLIEYIY